MFNGSDYTKAWLRISWLFLLFGLLVFGLGIWHHWPTIIALIAMEFIGLGILMKITSPLFVRVEAQDRWYLVIPVLVILTMLFGIAPVLLTLAYLFGSPALLRVTGIVAGIGVVAFVAVGEIFSRSEEIGGLARIVKPMRARTWPTESSEEDDVPRS